MTTNRISLKDTGKAIRETLKVEFPGVKFSVRGKSYSGGSSIDIEWTDGPTKAQVNEVVEMFKGASFDPMQDLKSYRDLTNEDGEKYHYGTDYVFCSRITSPDLRMLTAAYVAKQFNVDTPAMINNWFSDYGDNLLGYKKLADLIRDALNFAIITEDGGLDFLAMENEFLPGWLIPFEMDVQSVAETILTAKDESEVIQDDEPANEQDEAEINPALAALLNLDIDALTPLDALIKLYELKKLAQQ